MSAAGRVRGSAVLAPVPAAVPPASDAAMPAAGLAERAFVGCLFWLPVAEGRAAVDLVGDSDLADPQLRAVLAACRSMLAEGRRADPALVTPRMVRAGLPAQLAGLANALVVELVAEPLVPECWRGYAREVLAGAAVRRVEAAGMRLLQGASSCPELGSLRELVVRETTAILAELARAEQATS